jgi:hypothetical protein
MRTRMVNGREVDISEDPDGVIDLSVVRREADVDGRTMLMEQSPNGENFILPKDGSWSLGPGSHLMTMPLIRRG